MIARWLQVHVARATAGGRAEETGLRATDATELLRAGVHGGHHHYFLMTCENLEIGAVTGPELEYAANADFRAEWVTISELRRLPVWPRCVAELIAEPLRPGDGPVPFVEDDRHSWDGVPEATMPANIRNVVRVVLFREDDERRHVAAVERVRGGERYFTLPGGGVEAGETVDDAVCREAREELGVEVRTGAKLAVVAYRRPGRISLQTYIQGTITAGEFGTGTGEEFTEERQRLRGTYKPCWLDVRDLPPGLRPPWLLDRLPAWARHPPGRPQRFCEVHDD